MTANLPFTYPVVPTSGKGRGIFRPRARYFPGMESTQRSSGRRPHKVRCAQDAQVWASLAALPCSSSPNHDHSAAVSGSAALRMRRTPCGYYVGSWLGSRGSAPYDFRTRGARLENGLNLFGAGMNLGQMCPPPAAARAGQIRRSFLSHIAPPVCLAFSALLGAFSLFRRAR